MAQRIRHTSTSESPILRVSSPSLQMSRNIHCLREESPPNSTSSLASALVQLLRWNSFVETALYGCSWKSSVAMLRVVVPLRSPLTIFSVPTDKLSPNNTSVLCRRRSFSFSFKGDSHRPLKQYLPKAPSISLELTDSKHLHLDHQQFGLYGSPRSPPL